MVVAGVMKVLSSNLILSITFLVFILTPRSFSVFLLFFFLLLEYNQWPTYTTPYYLKCMTIQFLKYDKILGINFPLFVVVLKMLYHQFRPRTSAP